MKCIKCNGNTKVTETASTLLFVLRKRKCLECGNSFITREVIDNAVGMNAVFNKIRKGLKV